jgi:hypothetical protein
VRAVALGSGIRGQAGRGVEGVLGADGTFRGGRIDLAALALTGFAVAASCSGALASDGGEIAFPSSSQSRY